MKKVLTTIIFVAVAFQSAFAQYTGQLTPAETVYKGSSIGGVYAGIYESAIGILGQYRYGVGGYTDVGAMLGFVDIDHASGGVVFNFDAKYQVMEMRIQDPIDLSVGGLFGFSIFDHVNTISFGGTVTGSYPFKMRNGRTMTPYGRFILRIDREDIDHHGSDTNFQIGFNLGGSLQLSSSTRAVAELQFDDVMGFYMGLDFGL